MALADTARLIASLELQDKFSRTADSAESRLGRLESRLEGGARRAGVFGTAVGTALGIGLERAVGAGVRVVSRAITGGVEALNQLQSVQTATNTVLQSTQGVSGQTAAGVRALAEEYENLNATMDDKVIQSGANMLLTFTKIRGEAFEPALEAALNLNEAMGGGPDGLQNAVIQVGKALNDPIQGIGALRRVGVQLDEQQERRIRLLVEQNDLYGAQQVILDELATQFGGRFAAAGQDEIARQATLRDRIEDVQKALAGPLMPAISRARESIIDLLGSPAVLQGAERLGDAIAGVFSDRNLARASSFIEEGIGKLADFDWSKVGDGVSKVFGFLGEVPWGTIGEGLKITGQAAKVAVDAFLALPKEVQGLAISALAVNKLTGGLAGSIAGGLAGAGARGLGGAVGSLFNRGGTPATPVFTKEVGLPGVGGGGPVAGGGGGMGMLGRILGLAGVAIGGVAIGAHVGTALNESTVAPAREFATDRIRAILESGDADRIQDAIRAVRDGLDPDNVGQGIALGLDINGVRTTLETELAALQEEQRRTWEATGRAEAATRDAIPWAIRNVDETARLNSEERTRAAAALEAVRATQGPLNRIAEKDFNPEVNVHARFTANVGISIHEAQRVRLSALRSYSESSTSTNSAGV